MLCKVQAWNVRVDSSVGTETNTDENLSQHSVNSDEEVINWNQWQAPITCKIQNEREKTMSENKNMSAIDQAIAAAKARKAAKEAANGGAPSTSTGESDSASAQTVAPSKKEKPVKEKKEKKPAVDEAARAAKKAQIEADRAARKAKKESEREAKKAEKEASKKPAHMVKVLKAGEKLPALDNAAITLFNEATTCLSQAQLAALAMHIQFFNRVKATERALNTRLEEGMAVTIVGGDPRYVGKTGTLSKVQRIRCYVELDSEDREVYCFTSDVTPRAEEETEESSEEEDMSVSDEAKTPEPEAEQSTGTEN